MLIVKSVNPFATSSSAILQFLSLNNRDTHNLPKFQSRENWHRQREKSRLGATSIGSNLCVFAR